MTYAPRLGFHWSGVVASSIAIEASGRIGIFNNPGTAYENFIANIIYANSSFQGNLTGNVTGDVSGNSATTSQRTFSNVKTDGINRGSYGAISIAGSTNTYSGIDFTDASVTLMVRTSDGLSGMYKNNNAWIWYFDGSGVLTVGTVPGGSVSGTVASATNATTAGGLVIETGRNNNANRIVRTDANGYIQCGYINSSNGNENNNSNADRVWGTNGSDDYLRTYRTSALSVSYAATAGSAPANGGTATAAAYLNAAGYIYRGGFSGNWNTDFQNTPASSYRYYGDNAGDANSPGGSWWFSESFRHSNGSNYWGTQVAWGWEDNANRLATRNVSANSFGGWVYYMNTSAYPYAANMNQYVRTSDGPTFAEVYNNGWYRTNGNSGLYFQAYGRGIWAADSDGLSYGNVATYGTGMNNYYGYGMKDSAGYRSYLMFNNGSGGIYMQDRGDWMIYYAGSTASYSIGSSGAVPGYTLYLIYGLYTVGLYNASDARMKKDIAPLSNSLDKIKLLRGVSYEYIDKGPNGTKNRGTELGFIAQEVLPVIPELIRHDEEKGYAMNYNGVSAVLVEAVKEQQIQIESQQIQIENQQNQINSLILQLTELLNK
jgi:uncharacterized protein YunC (DUF1805 family)